jgi:hypothetical protein
LLFRMPLALHRLVLSSRARLQFTLDQLKGATSMGLAIKPYDQRKDDCSRQNASQDNFNKRKVD